MRVEKNAVVVFGCSAMFFSIATNMLLLQAGRSELPSTRDSSLKVVDSKTFSTSDLLAGNRRIIQPNSPKARLQAIQRELRRIGYAAGNVDGLKDTKTEAAILAFEHDHGLALKAEPSSELLQALVMGLPRNPGLSPSGASPAARHLIQTVQASLARLKFDVGAIDGRLGPQTRRAIIAFETRHQLKRTGRVSSRLLSALASRTVTRRMSMVQR